MGRTVTAVVTHDGACAGTAGPVPVGSPWWSDVEPVVTWLEETLGVPAVVLRLLSVEGSGGPRDGHVTYHAEALQPPGDPGTLAACDFTDDDHPLRMPWARASGVRELLGWAAGHVTVNGRPAQRKTWNLAALFRLPAAAGPVWLKAIPGFAAAEPAAIAAFAEVDPGLVPTVLATAQARMGPPPAGLPDRRLEALAATAGDLLGGPAGAELNTAELRAARRLQERWEMLAGCGLPDTVVHGDFHPGNWRCGDGPPVVLDFADAHLGHPVLDGLRAIDYLPASRRRTAADAWISAWTAAVPRSRPAEALRIAEPLAHFANAVRYQEFLDNIEPSERVYHRADPIREIRKAITCPPA